MTKRRTRGDGSLYKRAADGVWIGRVELPSTDGRRRFRTVSSKDRNEAIRKLKKLRQEIDAGKIAVTGKTTVGQWLNRWLSDIHATEIRPTTRQSYESVIRNYILPQIGQKRLDRLTPEHVREMHRVVRESVSGRAAQKAHQILQRALDDAEREGMLTRNVAKVVHKPKYLASVRDPLTADQAKTLLRSAIDNDDPLATRWAAALLLGARQGELLGLQWDRVDLEYGIIDLSKQLQRIPYRHGCDPPCGRLRCRERVRELPDGFEAQFLYGALALTKPKTKAGTRIIPIPAPLWALLKQYPGVPNRHDLVWARPSGEPIDPRNDYNSWQDALETAGLPSAPLHAARHTTASLLAEAGVPEHIRMEILGQVAVQAHRGYVHVDTSQTRKAMQALDNLLSIE